MRFGAVHTHAENNAGLRFDHESGIRECNNKLITAFDTTAANPLQAAVSGLTVKGAVQYAGVNGARNAVGDPLALRAALRLGLAYSLNNKTVIRGGYGIYWAPSFFSYQNTIGYSQTTSIVTSNDGNYTPAATLSLPLSERPAPAHRQHQRRPLRYRPGHYHLRRRRPVGRLRPAVLP